MYPRATAVVMAFVFIGATVLIWNTIENQEKEFCFATFSVLFAFFLLLGLAYCVVRRWYKVDEFEPIWPLIIRIEKYDSAIAGTKVTTDCVDDIPSSEAQV